jgi:hypothetical protein
MKKKMLLIVTLCLLSANAARASRQAGCIVTIETDFQFLPLTNETVYQIIYSPAVAPLAYKLVFDKEIELPDLKQTIVLMGNSETADRNNRYVCEIQIELNNKDLPPVAEIVLQEVTVLFKRSVDDAYIDFIKQKSGNWTRLQENIGKARAEWRGRNSEYADFIKNSSIPHDNIPEYIFQLTEDIEEEELDIRIMERQLKEFANRRRAMENELSVRLQDDPIAKQLSKLVEIEAAKLENKKKGGGISTEWLEAVEKNLLNARIELGKRQEQLSQQAQSELSEITKQIADMSMNLPDLVIRRDSLFKKLARAKESLKYSHQYETLELERKYAKKNLERAMGIYQDAKLDIEMYSPPTVIAIGIE